MTKKEEEELDLKNRDFSIVMSSRKKKPSLFLGPARFANHDCNANAKLSTTGHHGMQIVSTRNIELGEESPSLTATIILARTTANAYASPVNRCAEMAGPAKTKIAARSKMQPLLPSRLYRYLSRHRLPLPPRTLIPCGGRGSSCSTPAPTRRYPVPVGVRIILSRAEQAAEGEQSVPVCICAAIRQQRESQSPIHSRGRATAATPDLGIRFGRHSDHVEATVSLYSKLQQHQGYLSESSAPRSPSPASSLLGNSQASSTATEATSVDDLSGPPVIKSETPSEPESELSELSVPLRARRRNAARGPPPQSSAASRPRGSRRGTSPPCRPSSGPPRRARRTADSDASASSGASSTGATTSEEPHPASPAAARATTPSRAPAAHHGVLPLGRVPQLPTSCSCRRTRTRRGPRARAASATASSTASRGRRRTGRGRRDKEERVLDHRLGAPVRAAGGGAAWSGRAGRAGSSPQSRGGAGAGPASVGRRAWR